MPPHRWRARPRALSRVKAVAGGADLARRRSCSAEACWRGGGGLGATRFSSVEVGVHEPSFYSALEVPL
jgi:hypothetical protein